MGLCGGKAARQHGAAVGWYGKATEQQGATEQHGAAVGAEVRGGLGLCVHQALCSLGRLTSMRPHLKAPASLASTSMPQTTTSLRPMDRTRWSGAIIWWPGKEGGEAEIEAEKSETGGSDAA
jgi:hypothetical protein